MVEAIGKNDAGFIDKMRWDNQPEENLPHNQLTQKDFFALLTKQLSMQDPFKPMQNENMIAQMTSFASVDGINALKEEILNLNSVMTSSQALEASGLVGRKVLTESDATFLEENSQIKGTVDVPEGVRANTVLVQDGAGQLIANVPMPMGVTGNVEFLWDGMDMSGKPAPEGMYRFSCQADIDGQTEQLQIYTYGHVASVSLGGRDQGTLLNILGRAPVSLDEVIAVAEA